MTAPSPFAPSDDALWSALVRWIASIIGVTVIRYAENAPRPTLPYVLVNFTGSNKVRDHASTTLYDMHTGGAIDSGDAYPDAEAFPVIEREWRYSIHAYGPVPTDLLRPLESAGRLPQILEPLGFPGIILHEMSQVRNVPELVNNLFEPRANVDIFLRGLTADRFEVAVITATEAPTIERIE